MARFGLNGQLIRKSVDDSIGADLVTPVTGRVVVTGIAESGGVVTLTYLDDAGTVQTASFAAVAVATTRTIAFGWGDDLTFEDSDFVVEATGFSPQRVTIPTHTESQAYSMIWVSGDSDTVDGGIVGQQVLRLDNMTGPVEYTRGGEAGHLWRSSFPTITQLLSLEVFEVTW